MHKYERVKDGELALHLYEYDEMINGTLIRYQEIATGHKGKLCKHVEILGPSAAYNCGPVRILAAIETNGKIAPAGDTAGDLREIAQEYRESGFITEQLAERAGNSTLVEDWHKVNEMKRQLVKTSSRTVASLAQYKSTV